ncbi:MAG: hypothetical protein PHU53_07370 [Thermoplasmata archaeon]|nr:hypothetical protein [Thermoplasmata archaeon]
MTEDTNELTEMYKRQAEILQEEDRKPMPKPSVIGSIMYSLGLFSSLFFSFFILIYLGDFCVSIAILFSILIMFAGILLLKRTLHQIWPLTAGVLFAYNTFFGFLLGLEGLTRADFEIFGFIAIILSLFTTLSAVCTFMGRKKNWALIGGVVGIILGINLQLYHWIFFIISLLSVIIIFLLDEHFEE